MALPRVRQRRRGNNKKLKKKAPCTLSKKLYLCNKSRTYNNTHNEISEQLLYISPVYCIFAPAVENQRQKHKVARMVESVDTKDLKSFGLNSRAGSSPASSTGLISCKSMIYERFFFLPKYLWLILKNLFFG